MSLRSDWPCWEIMKCHPDDVEKCPACNAGKPCWEAMRELNICSFNVCRDCLVYISKEKNSIFSKEEIRSILCQKGIDVVGRPTRCPGYKSMNP